MLKECYPARGRLATPAETVEALFLALRLSLSLKCNLQNGNVMNEDCKKGNRHKNTKSLIMSSWQPEPPPPPPPPGTIFMGFMGFSCKIDKI